MPEVSSNLQPEIPPGGAPASPPPHVVARPDTTGDGLELDQQLLIERKIPKDAKPDSPTQTQTCGVDATTLLRINSWPELEQAYRSAGVDFSTDQQLYLQVRSDWRRHSLDLILAAHQTQGFGKPFEKQVSAGGVSYHLMGVVHSLEMFFRGGEFVPDYLQSIAQSVRCKPFWVVEHNLTSGFLPIAAPEIPDHNVDGILFRTGESLARSLSGPLRHSYQYFSRKLRSFSASSEASASPTPRLELLERLTHLHPDALAEVPAQIELLWRDRNHLPYSRSQRRSAYQAAFLQSWDPERSYQIPAEERAKAPFGPDAWKERGIIVGAAHVNEIEYFLEHGIGDPKVKARAEQAASKLNEGINVYQRYIQRQELKFQVGTAVGALGIGLSAGTLLHWIF
jgi:hypothetical protein